MLSIRIIRLRYYHNGLCIVLFGVFGYLLLNVDLFRCELSVVNEINCMECSCDGIWRIITDI